VSFRIRRLATPSTAIDLLFQNRQRIEQDNPSRRDWGVNAGLRVPAHALAFLANGERAER
jgi:hypothetical protein